MSHPFQCAKATYTKFPLEEFRGNPLVEAMNPFPRNDGELDQRLRALPLLDESQLDLPPELRAILPKRLEQIFLPGPQHRRIFRMCYGLMLSTYRDRNPLTPQGQRHLYHDGTGVPRGPSNRFGRIATIIGPSGLGKSTTIGQVLGALGPQVIQHEDYNGTPFHETQLLYHYLNVNESLRPEDIYLHAGRTAGQLTGNKLLMKSPGMQRSPDDKRAYCFKVLRNSFNALLIIDNIEYLFRAPNAVKNKVLSMLNTIRDNFEIPMLLIGTVEAGKYLRSDDSVCSRFIEGGYIELQRPEGPEDPYWDDLVTTIWSYSWVKDHIELEGTNLKELIYDLTQGITRYLITLLVQAQIIAIESGTERVDETALRHAYATCLQPVHPIIEALKSKNESLMGKFESMYSATLKALPGCEVSQTQLALEEALRAKLAANAEAQRKQGKAP